MKIHDITGFKWRHPIPSLAVAWNAEYDGHHCLFLACVTWWKWCAVFSWSKPNKENRGVCPKGVEDAKQY